MLGPTGERERFEIIASAALSGILSNSERFKTAAASFAPPEVAREAIQYAEALWRLIDERSQRG
jgi:hypothetical protein